MSDDRADKCQYRKCGKPSEIIYLGCGLCEKHWVKICDMPTEKAHKTHGIRFLFAMVKTGLQMSRQPVH